jgi:hypothetical protein
MRAPVLLVSLVLAGCNVNERPTAGPTRTPAAWQSVATEQDRQRLREWRQAFSSALTEARAAGHGPALDREGVLLLPDAALGGGIPNGTYRCRTIKLGARSQGMLPFVSYPAFTCRIVAQGRLQRFEKLTGSQRQVGHIFAGDQLRSVFLGSLVLGDEIQARPYGADEERDLAGFVERIGDRRWRLILPYPRFESLIDVIELVPAT